MELRADNPCDRILPALGPQNDVVQHMRALPHREVAAALATVRASTVAEPPVKLVFEFLVLTASRSGEARQAQWAEMDTTARVWTVPATRMKAKREHRVPLCRRTLAIRVPVGNAGRQQPHTAITTGCAVIGMYSNGVNVTPARMSRPSRRRRVTSSSACHISETLSPASVSPSVCHVGISGFHLRTRLVSQWIVGPMPSPKWKKLWPSSRSHRRRQVTCPVNRLTSTALDAAETAAYG